MNFQQCLSASVRRGDVTKDYEERILSISWPGRGVYDDKTVVCGSHMAQVYSLFGTSAAANSNVVYSTKK